MVNNWNTENEIYDDLSNINSLVMEQTSRELQVDIIMALFNEHTYQNKVIDTEVVLEKVNMVFDFLHIVGRLYITKEDYVIARFILNKYGNDFNRNRKEFMKDHHITQSDRKWHMTSAIKLFKSVNKETIMTVTDMIYSAIID